MAARRGSGWRACAKRLPLRLRAWYERPSRVLFGGDDTVGRKDGHGAGVLQLHGVQGEESAMTIIILMLLAMGVSLAMVSLFAYTICKCVDSYGDQEPLLCPYLLRCEGFAEGEMKKSKSREFLYGDGERLDYLQREGCVIAHAEPNTWSVYARFSIVGRGKTLRKAIDDAKAQEVRDAR